MSPDMAYRINEVIEAFADSACDDDYLLSLWVEREINAVRQLGVPWKEIHALVKEWFATN